MLQRKLTHPTSSSQTQSWRDGQRSKLVRSSPVWRASSLPLFLDPQEPRSQPPGQTLLLTAPGTSQGPAKPLSLLAHPLGLKLLFSLF